MPQASQALAPPGRRRFDPRLDALRAEALAFWDSYLWHHRAPWTRRLHRAGSYVCLVGIGATLAGYGLWWAPLSIAVGYLFAFAGHWFVERNRPLTFGSPIRAGIANWVMFVYEMFYDVEADIERLSQDPPETCDGMSSC